MNGRLEQLWILSWKPHTVVAEKVLCWKRHPVLGKSAELETSSCITNNIAVGDNIL